MKDFVKLSSLLLASQTQAHIFHLQTKSYAEHMALSGYYTAIDGLVDGLVEDYQGQYDIIEEYASFKMIKYADNKSTIKYFEELNNHVEQLRKETQKDFNLQNAIDNVVTLINTTIYKLKFLS